jgi:sugar/nucleoside kinase (ribokinase family)
MVPGSGLTLIPVERVRTPLTARGHRAPPKTNTWKLLKPSPPWMARLSVVKTLSPRFYMDEGDIDEEYIGSSRALFLTGITPALSDSCYRAFRKAIDAARSRDIDIVLDTNIRMKLWKTPERAREALLPVLRDTRILITNKEDLAVLYPEAMDSKKQHINKLLNLGIEMIVIKRVKREASSIQETGRRCLKKPSRSRL